MAVANALGQCGSKCVTAAPWKSPMMAWSTVWDDCFRVAVIHPKSAGSDLGVTSYQLFTLLKLSCVTGLLS
jgi:hypothetical protein